MSEADALPTITFRAYPIPNSALSGRQVFTGAGVLRAVLVTSLSSADYSLMGYDGLSASGLGLFRWGGSVATIGAPLNVYLQSGLFVVASGTTIPYVTFIIGTFH